MDRTVLVSIVICTYCRTDDVGKLLASLAAQQDGRFEVIVVDGNDEPSPELRSLAHRYARQLEFKIVPSPRGLTRQRNVGIRHTSGDLICFLDDDVTVGPDFVGQVISLFRRPDLGDIGGLTGYDMVNYPAKLSARWRLRRLLGAVPSLQPGAIDRFGRSMPLSFFRPFSGYTQVGFFHGWCMIYRRTALAGLWFDEELATYAAEDRDFSFLVSKRCRLVLCGDLHLWHHSSPAGRDVGAKRMHQTGFGAGRSFAKHWRGGRDYLALCQSIAVDFLVDTLAFLAQPGRERLRLPFARLSGTIAGFRSLRRSSPNLRQARQGIPRS
jgi:glycosyltransferase involved in cell wall biosynthesis